MCGPGFRWGHKFAGADRCKERRTPGRYRICACFLQSERCVCVTDFTDRKKFEEALYDLLLQVSPDLIVLAGFLLKVPDSIVMHFENRIINIHPSLIPSFCGEGAYGIKVHEMALQRGVRVSGATVHFVDKGMDTGPILLQKAVDVRQGDTPQSLQKRIMEQAEWQILPLAVDWISRGKVKVNAQHRVEIEDEDQ